MRGSRTGNRGKKEMGGDGRRKMKSKTKKRMQNATQPDIILPLCSAHLSRIAFQFCRI